jgi:pyruvate carboxylase
MRKALREYILLGIKTPIPFLLDVLDSEPFKQGEVFTDFIQTHFNDWKPKAADFDIARIAFIVDELLGSKRQKVSVGTESETLTPFKTLGNWRL